MPDAADINNYSQVNYKKKFNIKKNSIGYLGHLYQGRGIDLIIKLAKKNFHKTIFILLVDQSIM